MSDRRPSNEDWARSEHPADDEVWLRHEAEDTEQQSEDEQAAAAAGPRSDDPWLRYDGDPAQGTSEAGPSRADHANWLPPELEVPAPEAEPDPADPHYDTGLPPDLADHPERQPSRPADQPAYPEPSRSPEHAFPTSLTDPQPAGRHEKPPTFPEHTILSDLSDQPEPVVPHHVPPQAAVEPQPHGRHERPRSHGEDLLHQQPAAQREPAAYQARQRPQPPVQPSDEEHSMATQPYAEGADAGAAGAPTGRHAAGPRARSGQELAMLGAAGKELVIVIGMALVLSFIVKTWLLQAFYIPSGSMEDTLVLNDRVVVSKLTPGPFDINRGDIVVFADPGEWLSEQPQAEHGTLVTALRDGLMFVGLLPDDSENHLIKRVIGLPGDHVVCCDQGGRLTVNSVPILEPYIKEGDAASDQDFDIRVPAGSIWVMGDHRSNSSDSRFHDPGGTGVDGSVPESLVVGRAVALVWPLNHLTRLTTPEATFAKVPAAIEGREGTDVREPAPSESP